jgi:hypothetical protein
MSHKEDIENNRHRLSYAGLKYQISKVSRVYLGEEYAKYQERKETRTVMGIETEIAKNTIAYNEYRLDNGSDGSRNQDIIGLRNKFMLRENITGNFSAEYQSTISGQMRHGDPDAFAIAGGLEYLPQKDWKVTSRLEYRNDNSDAPRDTYLAEFGAGHQLNPEYSLFFKERFFLEDMSDGGESVTQRTILGIAYRPLHCDTLNVLGKMEHKRDKDTSFNSGYSTDSYIPSIEGVYQVGSRLQLTGKYAGKWVEDDEFESYTDLVSGRILYDINKRLDLGVTYRVLTSHEGNNCYQGGSAEIGCRLIKDLWLTLGYSFDDFDADLTEDSYRGQGPYLKFRVKFDENTFKSLNRSSRLKQKIAPKE